MFFLLSRVSRNFFLRVRIVDVTIPMLPIPYGIEWYRYWLVWLLFFVLLLIGMGIGTSGRRIEFKSFEKSPIDSEFQDPESIS